MLEKFKEALEMWKEEKLICSPTPEGRAYRQKLLRMEEELTEIERKQGISYFTPPKPPEYKNMPDEIWEWFSRLQTRGNHIGGQKDE